MSQTVPPPSDTPRPLPRIERGRTSLPKPARPRFQALDAVWLAVITAAFLAASFAAHRESGWLTPTTLLSILTLTATYLLGLRIAGRGCGIVSGLLTATSYSYVASSASWEGNAFTLATVAALFACAADLTLPACAFAGLATAIRPDGTLLALLLLALFSIRVPKQAMPGAALLVLIAASGWAIRLTLGHQIFPVPVFHAETWPIGWAVKPASLFLLWFLAPFCADLTDTLRRPRWLPVALWAGAYALANSVVHFAPASDTAVAMMPIVFLMVGGGMARLLPTLAGERPEFRYALATLAVAALLIIRGSLEWRAAPPVSAAVAAYSLPMPEPAAAPPVPVALPPPPVAPRMKMPHPYVKKALVKKAVPLYAMYHGRLVKRSKWAIQWDVTHPKSPPVPQAIGPARVKF